MQKEGVEKVTYTSNMSRIYPIIRLAALLDEDGLFSGSPDFPEQVQSDNNRENHRKQNHYSEIFFVPLVFAASWKVCVSCRQNICYLRTRILVIDTEYCC